MSVPDGAWMLAQLRELATLIELQADVEVKYRDMPNDGGNRALTAKAMHAGRAEGLRTAAGLVRDLVAAADPINSAAQMIVDTMTANQRTPAYPPGEHRITIDVVDNGLEDYKAKCFCECGWADERWHHADEFPVGDWETNPGGPTEAAYDAATAVGQLHVRENS